MKHGSSKLKRTCWLLGLMVFFFFFLAIGLVKLGLSTFFVFKWQVGLVSLLWAETSVY